MVVEESGRVERVTPITSKARSRGGKNGLTTHARNRNNLMRYTLKYEPAATSSGDDEVHRDHHNIGAPTVRAVFSPEPRVPCEFFLPDRSEHYENEPDGSARDGAAC